MSGLDVLKHIQQRKHVSLGSNQLSDLRGRHTCTALVQLSPAARVIMLSGNDPSDDERNIFLQAGAAAFWVKPVSARQIESLTK